MVQDNCHSFPNRYDWILKKLNMRLGIHSLNHILIDKLNTTILLWIGHKTREHTWHQFCPATPSVNILRHNFLNHEFTLETTQEWRRHICNYFHWSLIGRSVAIMDLRDASASKKWPVTDMNLWYGVDRPQSLLYSVSQAGLGDMEATLPWKYDNPVLKYVTENPNVRMRDLHRVLINIGKAKKICCFMLKEGELVQS